jgi:hypothetical protein
MIIADLDKTADAQPDYGILTQCFASWMAGEH